jgi:hypothetical protein
MVRWQVTGAVLAVLVTALGCAENSSGDPDDAKGAPFGNESRSGGASDDGPDGGGGAVGAPINIPSIVQDQGRPLVEVQSEIEKSVREQCGDGELCVELQLVETEPNFDACQFVRTEPPQGTTVERGSTVLIVAGTQDCDETGDPSGDTTEDDGTTDEGGTSDEGDSPDGNGDDP